MIKAKGSFPKILAVWQPVGYSTYQIANTLADKFQTKVTHTGVLDPLAEGVVIFLLGEERFKKQEYSNGKKTYIFEITFGISTDSYDAMGLITSHTFDQPNLSNLQAMLSSFIGKYTQTVPLYSAIKVSGKKLFVHAKEKTVIETLPEKKGEIFDLMLLGTRKVSLFEIVTEAVQKIEMIKAGQFRQKDIIDNWNSFWMQQGSSAAIMSVRATFQVTMSRGLYVRSLAQDICQKINSIGYVSKLVRVKNGDHSIENSKTLNEIFGPNFDHSMLVSKFL